ncbi:MAG: biotin transporter BioY [Anaerolineae bacterium]|nr:biotin transporter BioY [Anaerolineae bacterium]MDW8068857.1 biotin transporter BioY [Anaerolineae bacterium]
MERTKNGTLADTLIRSRTLARDAWLVGAGSVLVGLMAQIAIPLPFTPVPVTGQTFGVLLVGALLGCRRGALSLVLYLLEGIAGLPVFAGGSSGLTRLLGPTGGYLLGFVVAAGVTGWLCERGWDRRVPTAALAMLIGNLVIYLFGLPWLALFVGPEKSLVMGFWPFIPGDLLKLALAALVLPGAWRFVGEIRQQTQ